MSQGAHIKEGTKHSRKLRLPEVLVRVGVKKTKLYSMIEEGLFPKQMPLMANSRSVGWLEEEIANYEAGLGVPQSASPKAQVAKPAIVAAISAPSRTLPAPAKQTKSLLNHREIPATFDDSLVPTGMEIMGRPVFLHKKSGKVLLDIGLMSSQLIGNFASAMTTNSE
jgi:predicted DNA-binding transcriptional regulator AlpA